MPATSPSTTLDTPDAPTGRTRSGGPAGRWVRTHPTLISILILVVGALGLTGAHVRAYIELSPVDELQHIDYLYKAPEIVHSGEKVGQEAMHEQACRTLPAWPYPQPCDDTTVLDPDDFQEHGANSAAIYPPVYYTVTRAIATPLQALTGMDSLVTAGRLVGGLWLAGGLVMSLLAARRLGAHPYTATALLLATASVPAVLSPSATITPDAAALLAGAALLWSVLWWQESPRWRWWLPAMLSLAAVSVKALNILAVVLVALFVLLRAMVTAVRRRRGMPTEDDPAPGLGQSVLVIAAMSVVALAGAVGYIIYTGASAVAATDTVDMTARTTVDSFPVDQTTAHLGAFLVVLNEAGLWSALGSIGTVSQRVVGLVLFGGTFAAIFVARGLSSTARLLAISLAVVGVVGAPLIIAFTYVSQGIFVPIPGRYALTLIPAAVAVAAAVLRGRIVRICCLVFGVGVFLVTLAHLLR